MIGVMGGMWNIASTEHFMVGMGNWLNLGIMQGCKAANLYLVEMGWGVEGV